MLRVSKVQELAICQENLVKKVFTTSNISIAFTLTSYSSKIANPFVGLRGLAQISIGGEKVQKISE